MKRAFYLCLVLLTSRPAAGGELELDQALPLNEFLASVRKGNPELYATRQRWEAASSGVTPAGSWPDPRLSVRSEPDDAEPSKRMTEWGVSQQIPFPGKRLAEAGATRSKASLAWEAYREKTISVLTRAKQAYYRLHRVDRRRRVLQEQAELLRELTRAAQARLAAGGAEAGDAFAVQLELEEVKNRLFEADQDRVSAVYEMNALRNRGLEEPIGATTAPELQEVPLQGRDLHSRVGALSPHLRAAALELDAARWRLRRSQLGFAPDFELSYGLQRRPGGREGNVWGAALSLPFWWRRPLGELREASSRAQAAWADTQSVEIEGDRMVREQFNETARHLQLARNYRDSILPLARAWLETSRRSYESGRGNMPRLGESARALLRAQLEYEDEIYHYAEHWAELEHWLGVEISGAAGFPGEEERDGR